MIPKDAYHIYFEHVSNLNGSYADKHKSLVSLQKCVSDVIVECDEQESVYYNLSFGHKDFGLLILFTFCVSKADLTFRVSHYTLLQSSELFKGLVPFKNHLCNILQTGIVERNLFWGGWFSITLTIKTEFIDMSSNYQEPPESVKELTHIQSSNNNKES